MSDENYTDGNISDGDIVEDFQDDETASVAVDGEDDIAEKEDGDSDDDAKDSESEDTEESDKEGDDDDEESSMPKINFINEGQHIKKVTIIPESEHVTSNMMSVFEMTKATGIRAKQIQETGVTFLDKALSDDPIKMAQQEMNERRCPLLLIRQIDSEGEYVEIKRVNDMEKPYVYE